MDSEITKKQHGELEDIINNIADQFRKEIAKMEEKTEEMIKMDLELREILIKILKEEYNEKETFSKLLEFSKKLGFATTEKSISKIIGFLNDPKSKTFLKLSGKTEEEYAEALNVFYDSLDTIECEQIEREGLDCEKSKTDFRLALRIKLVLINVGIFSELLEEIIEYLDMQYAGGYGTGCVGSKSMKLALETVLTMHNEN